MLGELIRQLTLPISSSACTTIATGTSMRSVPSFDSASGEVIACEVKAAETVRSEDFRGIQWLARRLGDQFVAGMVLYADGQPLPFGDRLRAWPISTLSTLAPDVGEA